MRAARSIKRNSRHDSIFWRHDGIGQTQLVPHINSTVERSAMTKPIPDKAEVALEYPDKLYIGTFEHSSRFDAHLDEAGISLSLYRTGDIEQRKSIRMHFHYALFAEILLHLAKTVSQLPLADVQHRNALREAAKALYRALSGHVNRVCSDPSGMTPEEEVLLLHVME